MSPDLKALLRKYADGCGNVVDLGCMFAEALQAVADLIPYRLGVDVFDRYFRFAFDDGASYERADVLEWLGRQLAGSYDLIFAIDLLEHLDRHKGELLLDEIARVAGVRGVVFTPDGFVEQGAESSARELRKAYRVPIMLNPHQEHRSGWKAQDFIGRGWRVERPWDGSLLAIWENNGDAVDRSGSFGGSPT